jgi:hypothetical protein
MAKPGPKPKPKVDVVESSDIDLKDHPMRDRNDPRKLCGRALRQLGRSHGLATSTMENMSDAKIRCEISISQTNTLAREFADEVG